MKRFAFRLQRVLDVKNTIEEVKRRDFLAADNEYRKKIDELKENYLELSRYQDQLKTKSREEISTQVLNLYYSYFNVLAGRIEYQKKLIELARQEMEKKREHLIAAVKERKILEKLKEKQFGQYQKEFGAEEQKMLDEVSGNKFITKELNAAKELLEEAV